MQNSYTFTFDASKPLPYGLWLDIPFRTKGATALRSEAKSRGARFLPNGKNWNWWLPQNRITQDSVNWFNKHGMISGERKAPVFNPNAMKIADISLSHPFRIFLSVPFADRDVAKTAGALWDGMDKRWYFNATNLTQQRFDEMLKREWVYSFHGVLACNTSNTPVGIYFSKEDMGESSVQPAPAPVSTPSETTQYYQYTLVKTDSSGKNMLRTVFCHFQNKGKMWVQMYTNDTPIGEKMEHTVDQARSLWDQLISIGYTVKNKISAACTQSI
jgi:hypothetical protein